MTAAQNRETALKAVASLGGGKPDSSCFTPDAQWWVPGIGTFSHQEFLAVADLFTANLVGGQSKLTVLGVTAEGDRVAIEAISDGLLKNGKPYNNSYHYLFVFAGDKICMSKLYHDTKYVAEVNQA